MRFAIALALLTLTSVLVAAPTQDILLSVSDAVTLTGAGSVDDEDAVIFEVASADAGGTAGAYRGSPLVDLTADVSPAGADLDGIHWVLRPVDVPGIGTLSPGSVLVSFDVDDVSVPGPGLPLFINNIDDEDIMLFVPDTPGDFSAGTWSRFLDGSDATVGLNSASDTDDIDALCLVEQDITVGGVALIAGDLLLSFNGIPLGPVNARSTDVVLFRPVNYGSSSSGTFVSGLALFQGSDEGLAAPGPPDEDIDAIHLVYQDHLVGDTTVPAGSLIMSLADDSATVGTPQDLTANAEDVFFFQATTLGGGGGNTVGTFSPLLTGGSSDMGLAATSIDAMSLMSFPGLSATVTSLDVNGLDLMPGERIEYTMEIENLSAAHATGVSISAEIDSDTELVAVTGTGGGTDGSTLSEILVSGITVSPESTATVTWEVDVKADRTGGEIVHIEGMVAPAAEGGTGDTCSDTAGIVVVISFDNPSTDLLASDDNGGDLMPGDLIVYTLTLSNTTGVAATGVDISGVIPVDTDGLTVTDDGGGDASGSTSTGLSVIDVTIAASGSTVVTWTVNVAAGVGEAVLIQMDALVSAPDQGGSSLNLTSNELYSVPAELTLFTSD